MKYLKYYLFVIVLLVFFTLNAQQYPDSFLYSKVEKMPHFYDVECEKLKDKRERKQCADQTMLKVIYKNIRWPKELQNWCGGGRVILRFMVKANGSITDIEVVRGLHELFDVEAIRVVNLLDKWTPGTVNGKAIDMPYHLPIWISLE